MAEEYMYHVDAHNKVIGRVSRSEIRKKKLIHRGVDIFVMNSKGEILVTRRSRNKDLAPGMLELDQGGGVQYGESYEEAGKREIEEEVGIPNAALEYLFKFYHEWKGNKAFCHAFLCRHDGRIVPDPEEIEDCFFASVEQIKKMIHTDHKEITKGTIYVFELLVKQLSKQGNKGQKHGEPASAKP